VEGINNKFVILTFYRIQMRCPSGPELNGRVLHSLKSALAGTRGVLGSLVRRSTSPYGIELENLVFCKGTLSPLVGDHHRVCGDMIAVVEIVADRLVHNALAIRTFSLILFVN